MDYVKDFVEFPLLGGKVKFTPGQQNVFLVQNVFVDEIIKAIAAYQEVFDGYKTLNVLCDNGYEDGLLIIESIIDKAINYLLSDGYYDIDLDSFVTKYYAPYLDIWNEACAEIEGQYANLIADKENAKKYRQLRKASRGKFAGGGISSTVGGMITSTAKSMAVAGVANATTGAMHSVVNVIGDFFTDREMQKKAQQIYEAPETFSNLADALYGTLSGVIAAYIAYMQDYSQVPFEWTAEEQRAEVTRVLKNIVKLNIPDEKFKEIVVELIQKNPFDAHVYFETIKRLPDQYENVLSVTDFIGVTNSVIKLRTDNYRLICNELIESLNEINDVTARNALAKIKFLGEQEKIDTSVIEQELYRILIKLWESTSAETLEDAFEKYKNIKKLGTEYSLYLNESFICKPIAELSEGMVLVDILKNAIDWLNEDKTVSDNASNEFIINLISSWTEKYDFTSMQDVFVCKSELIDATEILSDNRINCEVLIKEITEVPENDAIDNYIISLKENINKSSKEEEYKKIELKLRNVFNLSLSDRSREKLEAELKSLNDILDNVPERKRGNKIKKVLLRNQDELIWYGKDMRYNNGDPLTEAQDVTAIKIAFSIPENLDVYYALSANIFGGFSAKSKGFAITRDGFYYRDDSKSLGMLPWNEFVVATITTKMGYLVVRKSEFNIVRAAKMRAVLADFMVVMLE